MEYTIYGICIKHEDMDIDQRVFMQRESIEDCIARNSFSCYRKRLTIVAKGERKL